MRHVTLHATTMGFNVKVDVKGTLIGTDVAITEFAKAFTHWSYDRGERRWILINEYFYFDKKNEVCYFPRFAMGEFIEFLTRNHVTHNVIESTPEEGRHVNFYMLPHIAYKNDKQKRAVEYLTNPASGPLRGLALQTGAGKTVSFIWGLQKHNRRSMITMTSRLEQWVKEIMAYTTLEEEDLFVIQGVGSLTKLFNQIDDGLKPKVILASAKTMRNYLEYDATYQHLPHPTEMCEKLGIGIIGTDEYHEHFYTNYLIGILLNPALFIPITATFVANDPFVKNIFNRFIPAEHQFVGGEYDRFVSIFSYTYQSAGHLIKPYQYMSRQGYSQQMFEKFLMTHKGRKVLDPLVEDVILPIIQEHYIDIAEDGERFLFLCSSTKLCDHLEGIFRRAFKNKTISVFYSGMPTTILEKYDIIISTPGSAGTGRDIKKLRTCFAFENTGSEIRNLQFLGRLRGPPQMLNEPRFITLGFSCIPAHVKYANQRAILYSSRALKFTHRTMR